MWPRGRWNRLTRWYHKGRWTGERPKGRKCRTFAAIREKLFFPSWVHSLQISIYYTVSLFVETIFTCQTNVNSFDFGNCSAIVAPGSKVITVAINQEQTEDCVWKQNHPNSVYLHHIALFFSNHASSTVSHRVAIFCLIWKFPDKKGRSDIALILLNRPLSISQPALENKKKAKRNKKETCWQTF